MHADEGAHLDHGRHADGLAGFDAADGGRRHADRFGGTALIKPPQATRDVERRRYQPPHDIRRHGSDRPRRAVNRIDADGAAQRQVGPGIDWFAGARASATCRGVTLARCAIARSAAAVEACGCKACARALISRSHDRLR